MRASKPSPQPKAALAGEGLRQALKKWFSDLGWHPLSFQEKAWAAYARGESGLIHAPTGQGKSLAAWLGPLMAHSGEPGLRVLWITPMRALAADTVKNLQLALDASGLSRQVASRTGDTSSAARSKQKKAPPFALVTTPESLSLLLTDEVQVETFRGLRAVIVDEWHELLGTKRGVQTELCLARLRWLSPELRIWGLSATLGNLDEAMLALLGDRAEKGILIHGEGRKPLELLTLMPDEVESFPWSGHLGKKLLPRVIEQVEKAKTTLVFTNTRSQTEIWFQEIIEARPEWREELALHHSSLDRSEREEVERRLSAGEVRCVVCTSSLDLGVDFSPVEQVIQIGSPKGIARVLQRAGRSGHQPGAVSRIIGVPTHALELVEFAALRDALETRQIESRRALNAPLDVLAQHLITVALGGGFHAEDMLREVRTTQAFGKLTDEQWSWVLTFVTTGGILKSYPQYQKLVRGEDGAHRLLDKRLARYHRMSIGTIVADAAVSIRLKNGRRLGSVEEWFIAGIRPGKCFIFGGRVWELVRIHGLVATVQVPSRTRASGDIPSWQGGKSPLSSELSKAVSERFRRFRSGVRDASPEIQKVLPLLEIQSEWSVLPTSDEFLIEHTPSQEGDHWFLYPLAGRLVNGAIGTLVAYRLGLRGGLSIRVTPNDYGVELFSKTELDLGPQDWQQCLSEKGLLEDVLASVNAAELGRHHFREIARVAGLIMTGGPGAHPSLKTLQTSSSLLWDVFQRYDPGHFLLAQAQKEVLERQMDYTRLVETLLALKTRTLLFRKCPRLTPLAFPLWADRISHTVGKEDPAMVLAKMLAELEAASQRVQKRQKSPQ